MLMAQSHAGGGRRALRPPPEPVVGYTPPPPFRQRPGIVTGLYRTNGSAVVENCFDRVEKRGVGRVANTLENMGGRHQVAGPWRFDARAAVRRVVVVTVGSFVLAALALAV